ncbi:MAG: asparagine synthase (glutamine-hydrolyzing) [Burkholderiales bacterium]|nr:asparagine synthase (glutamine-hydrolyzing) [Burkholderiales bacterium]
MCGINGIFAYADAAPPVDEAELLRTREHMVKRGPDGAGLWISPDRRVGLGHRRLAIIDLSETGAQPMATADGRLTITYNGEIYNYRKLRRELEDKGYVFRSQSDTEVLLHLYADRGVAMVHALRGMFAFGIWDARERALFLARDPFGIKPLYYADDGSALRFASQVKALLKGGAVNAAPEPAGSTGFLLWGCVPEPFTLYREIRALPPGSTMIAQVGRVREHVAYFSVREELARAQDEARPFRSQDRSALGEALLDAVQHHMVSDVPVGVFLSSGIDSTLVTHLAARREQASLRTLTLGFSEYRGRLDDEVPLAEHTAAVLRTRHKTHWISSEDFIGEIESILGAMDQPTTDGVNTYFVCQAAARAGIKVALSGLGGDEIFGGYPSFADVPRIAKLVPGGRAMQLLGGLGRALLAPLLSAWASPKYAGLLEYGGSFEGAYLLRRALYMPWELGAVLDPVTVHVGLERLRTLPAVAETLRGLRSEHARVAALEMSWYMSNQLLRDADWAGMAHSVEIRLPFVDATLFRGLAPWIVSEAPPRKADAATTGAAMLPGDIVARTKTGFAFPVREWTAGDPRVRRATVRGLRGWARRILPRQPRQFRALALVTDAFGGYGGIAKFNRDLLSAVAEMPECSEVVAIPRRLDERPGSIPRRVHFREQAAGGKLHSVLWALREAWRGPVDLVFAGHINLLALSGFLAWLKRARLLLVVHGIDAWSPHPSAFVRATLRSVDRVVGVSKLTLSRFGAWTHADAERFRVLPNCVDLARFTPGPKPADLARALGLEGRTVIMTLGRLASAERYKGFDEVIEALPALARDMPNIVYLVCGDGPDRHRLEEKARALGVGERVVFAGFVPEARKAEYYRLADAYVMPSLGEGFGIVYLEALACGVPTMGSATDGSREALLEGDLGELVDPSDAEQVRRGIGRTLAVPKGVPAKLKHFSADAFRSRVSGIVSDALA